MDKLDLDIVHFFETAPLEDLKEFHVRLTAKNDPVFDRLLQWVSSVMTLPEVVNEKQI